MIEPIGRVKPREPLYTAHEMRVACALVILLGVLNFFTLHQLGVAKEELRVARSDATVARVKTLKFKTIEEVAP